MNEKIHGIEAIGTERELGDFPKIDAPYEKVSGPKHYNGTQVIDLINSAGVGFEIGNVIKYAARSRKKGCELEDLKKAQWYLNWYIARLEKGEVE